MQAKIFLVSAALGLQLAACAQRDPVSLVRFDGQRLGNDPVLTQQATIDSTICRGDRQKASLSGVTFTRGIVTGAIAQADRSNAADDVFRGCMAEKGYDLVSASKAEGVSEHYRRVQEQKLLQAKSAPMQ